MEVQPINQGAVMLAGQQLVPDYMLRRLQERQIDNQTLEARTQATALGTQANARLQEQLQEQQLQAALAGMGERPTAAQLSGLIARFPRFREAISSAYNATDEQERNGVFNEVGRAASAVAANRPDLALQIIEQRVRASTQAGQPVDPVTQAVADGLRSNDPAQVAQAGQLLRGMLQAISGPEHMGSVTGAMRTPTEVIDGRAVITDPNDPRAGQAIYETPYPRIIPGTEGSFFQQPRIGVNGTPPAAAPAAPQQAPVRVRSVQERDALPPGAFYIDPRDGVTIRQRPGGPASAPGTFPPAAAYSPAEQGWFPLNGGQ